MFISTSFDDNEFPENPAGTDAGRWEGEKKDGNKVNDSEGRECVCVPRRFPPCMTCSVTLFRNQYVN